MLLKFCQQLHKGRETWHTEVVPFKKKQLYGGHLKVEGVSVASIRHACWTATMCC